MTVRITVTVRQWVLIAIFSLLLAGALVGLLAMDASATPRSGVIAGSSDLNK